MPEKKIIHIYTNSGYFNLELGYKIFSLEKLDIKNNLNFIASLPATNTMRDPSHNPQTVSYTFPKINEYI